jgi:hypothetical protein
MPDILHLSLPELEAGLETILQSPKDAGRLDLIVRRPAVDQREILEVGELDLRLGLVGDNWSTRRSSRTADGSAHPDMQLNIMNSRVIQWITRNRGRWQWAGDQLFLDLDLSSENLPPGTRLVLGSAVIEVTNQPHTGCKKFVERFGTDAMKFVNSPLGRRLCLRGINAKVARPGTLRIGDIARKLFGSAL